MTTGTTRARRVAAGLLFALGASTAVAADAFDAAALMRMLAANRESRADFIEKKYIAAVDRPVESSGTLAYVAPSRFEKRTVKPKPETLVVDGDTLSIERGGTKRSIALSSYPEAAAFTGSIRSTLAGDHAALARDYKVQLDGTPAQWRLTLLPSDPKIAALVSRVTMTGAVAAGTARIDTIEVLQADGNRSVTTLAPAPAAGGAR